MVNDALIGFRLPKEYRQKIEELIRQGKYEKMSQVVRLAVKKFLEKEENEKT